MPCSCCYCTFIALGKKAKQEGCDIYAIPTNNHLAVYKYPIGMNFQDCKDKQKYWICGMGGFRYCEKSLGE
jgi:hypothetical protein